MTVADRDKAIFLLNECLLAASEGHGSVIVVKGPIGAGKSTLLSEAAARGRQLGAATITIGASADHGQLPLGPLVRAASLSAEDRRLIARLAETSDEQRSTRAAALARAYHLVCARLLELAVARPLVITVDDVECADAVTLRALADLARQAPAARVVLVLARHEPSGRGAADPATDVSRQPHCHVVELPLLSETAVRDLARQFAGPRAGERHHRSWHRLSGGNPLLLEALAADLTAARTSAAEPAVGAHYGEAVVACARRGGARVLRVARGLAVLDDADGLAGLLGLPPEHVADAMRTLAAAGVIDAGRFRHDAARTAVLADMDAQERGDLRRAAAEIAHRAGAPATTVARHLGDDCPPDQDWAVDVLVDAANQLLRTGQVATAQAYLRTARTACRDERRRSRVTVLLVQAEWRIDPAVPAARFTELCDAHRRGVLSAGDAVALTRALLWHGRFAEAGDVLGGLTEVAARTAGEALPELIVLGRWMQATYPGLIDRRLRALVVRDRYDDTTPVSAVRRQDAAALLSEVLTRGPGGDLVDQAERILRQPRTGEPSFDATVWALKALTYGDQLERAASWFETVAGRFPVEGALDWRARLAAAGAEIALRTGDLRTARQRAREALDLLSRPGWGIAIGGPLSTLVLSATTAGLLDEAAELLDLPVSAAMFESRYGLQYLRARGRYHLAAGDPERALRDFGRCSDLMRSWDMTSPSFLPCDTDMAEAWLRLDRPDAAGPLVEAALAGCRTATPRAEGRALRVLAEISDRQQRPALLHRATDLLQAAGDRAGMAEALTALADAYRAVGSYRRAATIAGRARVVAAGLPSVEPAHADEAAPVAAAAEEDTPLILRGLSDAERRVASLAARGYSNREIAEQLWITVSTVEQHLTRAFRKLEVRRRVDLPDQLKAVS